MHRLGNTVPISLLSVSGSGRGIGGDAGRGDGLESDAQATGVLVNLADEAADDERVLGRDGRTDGEIDHFGGDSPRAWELRRVGL